MILWKEKMCHKGEQHLRYNMTIWKNKGDLYILNYSSEDVTLLQLTKTLGNMNHAISIVCSWIFDSNYENALRMERESLDLICSPFVGE